MRKHSKLLAVIVLISSYFCQAQNNSLFGELNYNTFFHSNLKSFQDEFIADISVVQMVKNDEFPANVGFTIGYTLEDINTSIFASYTSTGGKISYSDYSGIIRLSEAIYGITLGGEYLIDLTPDSNGKGDFNLGLRGFATFSDLTLESYSSLFDQIETDSAGLTSLDYGGGLRAIYEYPIAFFSLRITLGFDVVLGGKYKFKDNQDFHLEDNSGDPVKNGWTGLRSGFGISIPL